MAGLARPAGATGPEGKINILARQIVGPGATQNDNWRDTPALFDGVITPNTGINQVGLSSAGDYIEFEVNGTYNVNIWRLGTSTSSGNITLSKWDGTQYVTLTSTQFTQPNNAVGNWMKFAMNLTPGKYKYAKPVATGVQCEIEWFIEIIAPPYNWKGVAVTEVGAIKTFTENNVWVQQPAPEGGITKDYISTNGLPRKKLLTSLDTIYVPMVNTKTFDTGEKLWVTESDISTDLGITSMDLYQPSTGGLKVLLKVPPFLPKDQLRSTDKMYYYNVEGSFPEVINVAFSATVLTDHKSTVKVDYNIIHNFNEKIKLRHKVNDGAFSNWSDPFYAQDVAPNSLIAPSDLKLGKNTITIEVAVDGIEERTVTKVITDAITVNNDAPNLAIVTADSDAFRAHFVITDPNIGDQVQYRIMIRNSLYTDVVLVPWTNLKEAPLEIVYNIDTSKVVVGKLNALIIEYKDNFGAGASTTYSFEGSYRNLVFADSKGEYYTTDKGVLLKLLHLGNIYAGSKSLAFPITVKNSYGEPVTNVTINPIVITDAGVDYQLSKTAEPFNPLKVISYGDEIIDPGESRTFYVRGVASETAFGFGEFMLEVVGDTTTHTEELPPEKGDNNIVLKSARLETF